MTPSAFAHNTDLINSELIHQLNYFPEKFLELKQYPADMPFKDLLEKNCFSRQDDSVTTKMVSLNREQRRCLKTFILPEKPVEIVQSSLRDASFSIQELTLQFKELLEPLFKLADFAASPRQIEEESWKIILKIGQAILGQGLARISAQASEAEIKKLQLPANSIRFRMDKDYHITMTTTLGEITFPLFAFRVKQVNGKVVTHAPARAELFPFHRKCRSSELCLEWESRLGSQQTFRESESSLLFFSHGVILQADNTIGAHTVKVGSLIDRDYLYRSPGEIREILAIRATRNTKTGRPIVYFSTDAHAIRRFIDETWHGAWKMANGLRIWCVDQKSNQIIHLGGEFTWGDCEVVEEIFKSLTQSGHLPADGDYGDGILAEYVIVTDGAQWIEKRIVPIFPGSCAILDAYHALETISKHVKEIFGSETPEAKTFYQKGVSFLLGKTVRTERIRKIRKGHKKSIKLTKQIQAIGQIKETEDYFQSEEPISSIPRQIQEFIDFILAAEIPENKEGNRQVLIEFLRGNAHRIDYIGYRSVGYQIGSGAMESLHRTGSQMRLKIPGARWLAETTQAIFNIRMMTIVGKWNDFWKQANITEKLTLAFNSKFEVAAA